MPVEYLNYDEPNRLRDAVDVELNRRDQIPERPLGLMSNIHRTARVKARYGYCELLHAADAGGTSTLALPPIGANDRGRAVAAMMVSDTGSVVVEARPGETISGTRTHTITQDWIAVQFIAITRTRWLMTSMSPVSSTLNIPDAPWFEWNGTDLSEFDSIVYNVNATSSAAASVVSAAGVNWVQIAITSNGSSGAYDRNHQAILPITQTPPSANYYIRADCYVSTIAASNRFDAGFVLRWTTGTPQMGDGYCCQRQNSSGGIEIKRWNDAVSGSYGTETLLRTITQNDANDQTTDQFTIAAEVGGETSLMCQHEGLTYGHIETAGTFTAAGQACLMAGIGAGHSGSVSAVVRFRNIRAYEGPMETV